MLSFAVGLSSSIDVSRNEQPPWTLSFTGWFPNLRPGRDGAPDPLPLRESVKRYWYHLVPVTLFAPIAQTLSTRAKGPWTTPVDICLFFGSTVFASWPVITKRAKYSFWIFACALYIFGGLCLVMIDAIIEGAFNG